MQDEFEHHQVALTAPVTAAEAITPNDSTDLDHATRALYVGNGGAVAVEMLSGQTIVFVNLQPGVLYPLRLAKVLATGTTATGLVGLR